MSATQLLNSKPVMIAAGVLAAGLVVYFFGRRIAGAVGDAAGAAADAVSNVNQGTPYEGFGVVGTLGNVTDKLSGGILSRVGSWIGNQAYELFNKPYDPNAPATPATYIKASPRSPVRPEDKVTAYARF